MNFRFFNFFLTIWCVSANFLFGVLPVITGLNPSVGPATGATNVTISGSGFTGTTTVDFGTTPAAFFVVNSDSTITVISPPHIPQVISVTVTTPGGTSADNENSFFTYQGNWQAYVSSGDDDIVSVINVSTNAVTATVPVGDRPDGLALTPDGAEVIVANHNDDTISVIQTLTNTVSNTILSTGSAPSSVSITPDGTQAYVSNFFGASVTAIDISTNTVNATIPVGLNPTVISIMPNGTQAFVPNSVDTTVSVIDPATNLVIATPIVGTAPNAIGITPDETKAYVVNIGSGNVSVIDTATDLVITTILVGASPSAIAITPDGTEAYVTNEGDGNVSVIDTATDLVVDTISVGASPVCLIITPDGTRVYVVNSNDGTVSVIDVASHSVTDTITVGGGPVSIAITPDGKQIYISNNDDSTVSVINTTTNTASTIPVGSEPQVIGITPDQAPLARFSGNVQPVGAPSTFDASGSVSPTGLIANYFWDFGDSTTLSTTNPIVTHTYTAPGTFTVTLIVTNTAGTSLDQIFNFSAYSIFTQFGAGIPLTNNGGPTAETSQVFEIIIIAPPTNVVGRVCKQEFVASNAFVKILTWDPSVTADVVSYDIRRNGVLIANVLASGPLFFADPGRCNQADVYTITAITNTGLESTPVTVVI